MVSIDVADDEELIRQYYFDKLLSLKKVLTTQYLPEVEFSEAYELPEGKTVGKVFVKMEHVSIHNKKDWPKVKEFFSKNMSRLEEFFNDFDEFIKN